MILNTLLPNPHDKRDWIHSKVFGSTIDQLPGLPKEGLGRHIKTIKDQKSTGYCTAFASSTASEYMDGVEYSEEYSAAKEGEIMGQTIINGTYPRIAMQAGTDAGFLPRQLAPFNFSRDGWDKPADWKNYTPENNANAFPHRRGSYYRVTYGWIDDFDVFDSCKLALWDARYENGVISAFGFWYREWMDDTCPKTGILPMPSGNPIGRHAYIIVDWTTIGGVEYLVAHMSQGTQFGNNGVVYFSREVINKVYENSILNGTVLNIFRKLGAEVVKSSTITPHYTWIDYIKKFIKTIINLYDTTHN